MQPIRLDNAYGSPYAGQQPPTPTPTNPRGQPQPLPQPQYSPPQPYYLPSDRQIGKTLTDITAELNKLRRRAKSQKGKLKKAMKAAAIPPPPPPRNVETSTVLWGGLFLVLLVVLIIVIVQMVKTDASMTAINREHDHMRQWVQKLSYSSGNTTH